MNMKLLWSALESAFYVGMVILLTGAGIPLWREISGQPVSPVEGDVLVRALLAGGYALSLFLLLFRPKALLRALTRAPFLWLLVGWAFVSITWSAEPVVTLRRSVAILLTTVYAVALHVRLSFPRLIRILAWALLLVLGASLALVLFVPAWGVMGYALQGAWRGVFVHKNALGSFAALALLVFPLAYTLAVTWRTRLLWAIGFVFAVVTLVGSKSQTSLVLGIVLSIGAILLYFVNVSGRLWLAYLFLVSPALGGVGVWAYQNAELVLQALGRDATLTGRVPLWQALWALALERLWQGYGYSAFWLGPGSPAAWVWSVVGWDPSHGHNGYLDLLLDLGLVGLVLGLVLLLGSFGGTLAQFIRDRKQRGPEDWFWPLAGSFLIVHNFAESTFLRSNHLFWVLFVLLCLRVSIRVSIRRAMGGPDKERLS